jgi:signal transduction histidine kinase
MNLVLNGVEAARRRADGTPQVVVELGKSGDEKALMLVKDSGSGPDAAEGDRLFEPFVSGKPEGAGLGLYVARQIAQAHRGTIAWQRLDNMTCFTVELPLMES